MASAAMTGLYVGPADAVTGGQPWATIQNGPWPDSSTCLTAEALYTNTVPFQRLGCFYLPAETNGAGWYYEIKISVPTLPPPPPGPIGG